MEQKLDTNARMKKRQPIEAWAVKDKTGIWEVYKKYQKPDKEAQNPYARWFCRVLSPIVGYGEGEIGDVYIKDIKQYAQKVYDESKGNPYNLQEVLGK